MPQPRKRADAHALQGTTRSSTITNSPRFEAVSLKPPTWLSKEAKREFKRVVKVLEAQGQDYLTSVDLAALSAYAVNFAAWVDAEREIATRGAVIEQPITNRSTGNIVGHKLEANPALKISKDRQAAMLRAVQALGFDPRSRTSIDIPAPNINKSRTRQHADISDLLTQVAKEYNI